MVTTLALAALLAAAPPAVEVPFRIGEDAMFVDAIINGRKASLLFDSGFGGSVVVSDALDLGPSTGTVTLRDFVGEFQAKTIKIKNLKLGPMQIDSDGMEAVQQPLRGMSEGYNQHADGIMGMEVIKRYVTEINFENQRFVFHPKTVDVSKRTPDNKRTFLAKLLPVGSDMLEMEVAVPNGRKMVMSLDTGNAFFATTHKEKLERVGLWKPGDKPRFMHLSGIASGTVESFYVQMPALTIFGVPVPSSVWSIIDLPGSQAESDGTIGFGFLRNFNLIIDLERRRIWMENFNGKTGNEPIAEVGLAGGYVPNRKRVEIWRVTPESPAHKAGLKAGDEVLSIGDEDLHNTGFRRFEKLLQGEAGGKVRLAISRGGKLMRFELERAVLVNAVKV